MLFVGCFPTHVTAEELSSCLRKRSTDIYYLALHGKISLILHLQFRKEGLSLSLLLHGTPATKPNECNTLKVWAGEAVSRDHAKM